MKHFLIYLKHFLEGMSYLTPSTPPYVRYPFYYSGKAITNDWQRIGKYLKVSIDQQENNVSK